MLLLALGTTYGFTSPSHYVFVGKYQNLPGLEDMQAPDMTANNGAVAPMNDGLDNGPGKLFAESRDEEGVVKYTKFSDKPLRWREDNVPAPETYQETLSDKAIQGQKGYVFHAEALRTLGIRVFRTGDYHIMTTLRGKRDVVKFQTKEFLPGGQKWTGPRDIAHLAFLSAENGELPIYHFWLDPTIFEKKSNDMTLAEKVDYATSKQQADEEAKKTRDGLKMRLMPDITPSDQMWKDKLAEFEKLIVDHERGDRRRSLMDLMEETFLEEQIRRLEASGEHSRLSMLQGRDQLLYFDNLDNGAFYGVKNNAATKFCMVYFGLPVEPLTLTNIFNAKNNGDDAREKADPDYSILPRIYGAEADLEFLDSYHERSHGYPALRRPKAKRPYKDIPEEVSDIIREQQRIEEETYPLETRGHCLSSSNAHYGMDDDFDFSFDFNLESPKNDLPSFQEFLALRGGAGPSHVPDDNDDTDDAQLNDRHFNEIEDVIMDDVGLFERFDEDCEEAAIPGLTQDVRDLGGSASHPQRSSWIDGFDGGLRGGASSPKSNDQVSQEQRPTPSPPPNTNNGPGANTNDAAPAVSFTLPLSMEATLANLQKSVRPPRRRRAVPPANNITFDPKEHREYMVETAKSLEQDDLRVAAYHKAQSVHEPHAAKPEPPRYGKSVESQLVTGPTMPGVFVNNCTLSEIRQLQARNGELERLVLGRATYCGMCDKSISFTTKEQQDAHFAGHLDGLHSCGFCGISFNTASQAQRKAHLASHADTRYTKQATNTPQQATTTARPAAGSAALSLVPTAVSSIPRQAAQPAVPESDIVLYCQNCSVDLGRFTTPAQLIEHTRACPRRNRPPSEPVYCKFCGLELAILGSADDVTNHRNLCKGSTTGRGLQPELWALASTSTKDDPEMTYWKLCALTGVPDLHYKPHNPNPRSYECRYSGCSVNLFQEAKDGTLAAHHKRHILNGDRLKNICQADLCDRDLSRFEKEGKERLQRHLTRHLKTECAFPGCVHTFPDEDVVPSAKEIEVEAKKRWIDHAHKHLDDDEGEWEGGHGFSDSDPPSDNDGRGGRRGTAGRNQQGKDANSNVGPGGTGGNTRPTQGNNPIAIPLVRRAPVPSTPPPRAEVKRPKIPATGDRPKKPTIKSGGPYFFESLPTEWLNAWHRSVCPNGTKGCGVDDDNDLLVFCAHSATRVRNAKYTYDQVDMKTEGATTWGVTRKIKQVADQITRFPPSANLNNMPLLDPRFDVSSPEQERAGVIVRKQQASSSAALEAKAKKRAEREGKRGATSAPDGERPAKVAKGGVAVTGPVTPTGPPTETGGLFLSS